MLVLSRKDVESLLDPDALVEALSEAFAALSAGEASVPPRVAAFTPAGGLLGAMPGYSGGTLEAKLVTMFPGNAGTELPTHQALLALFDAEVGTPLAVMDGTHITAARTAAASALSTRELARQDTGVLAVVGAGVQGRAHLDAVPRVRRFTEIRVANRSPQAAEALPREFHATFVDSVEDAVRGADVVCLCTDAATAVVERSWLSPGTHVTSVGANPRGGELDPEIVRAGLLVVESRVAFEPPPAGAYELQGMDPGEAAELGEVIRGTRPGRTSSEQITVYKSMGHAVEDAAAARLVYKRALETGAGSTVEI